MITAVPRVEFLFPKQLFCFRLFRKQQSLFPFQLFLFPKQLFCFRFGSAIYGTRGTAVQSYEAWPFLGLLPLDLLEHGSFRTHYFLPLEHVQLIISPVMQQVSRNYLLLHYYLESTYIAYILTVMQQVSRNYLLLHNYPTYPFSGYLSGNEEGYVVGQQVLISNYFYRLGDGSAPP